MLGFAGATPNLQFQKVGIYKVKFTKGYFFSEFLCQIVLTEFP
jgi:hypothetical protein